MPDERPTLTELYGTGDSGPKPPLAQLYAQPAVSPPSTKGRPSLAQLYGATATQKPANVLPDYSPLSSGEIPIDVYVNRGYATTRRDRIADALTASPQPAERKGYAQMLDYYEAGLADALKKNPGDKAAGALLKKVQDRIASVNTEISNERAAHPFGPEWFKGTAQNAAFKRQLSENQYQGQSVAHKVFANLVVKPVGNVVEGIAGAGAALGIPGAEDATKAIHGTNESLTSLSPNALESIAQITGNIALMGAGFAGAGAVPAIVGVAAQQGGLTYSGMRAQGVDAGKARTGAAISFGTNLITGTLMLKFGISGADKPLIEKLVKQMPTQALFVTGQNVAQNLATGKPWYEGNLEAAGLGGLLAVPFATLQHISELPTKQRQQAYDEALGGVIRQATRNWINKENPNAVQEQGSTSEVGTTGKPGQVPQGQTGGMGVSNELQGPPGSGEAQGVNAQAAEGTANAAPQTHAETKQVAPTGPEGVEKAEPPGVEPPTPPTSGESATTFLFPSGPEGASLKNAYTTVLRESVGLSGLRAVSPETMAEWGNNAVRDGVPQRAWMIARDVIAGTHVLSDAEVTGFAIRAAQLKGEYDAAAAEFRTTMGTDAEAGSADRMAKITDEINDITEAGMLSGTETARALVARQAFFKQDMSFEGVLARKRAAIGRPMTQDEIAATREQSSQFEALQKQVEELKAAQKNGAVDEWIANTRASKKKYTKDQIQERRSAAIDSLKASLRPKGEVVAADPFLLLATARAAQRLKEAVPAILEIGKTWVDEGITEGLDLIHAIHDTIKSAGINDISEDDLNAIMGRQIPDDLNPVSEWTRIRDTFQDKFSKEYSENKKTLAYLKQLQIEEQAKARAARTSQREQRFPETTKQQKDLTKALADARQKEADLRTVEKAFWEELRWWQKSWEQGQGGKSPLNFETALTSRLNKGAARQEYINFWKNNESGRATKLMNEIDNLNTRLRAAKDSGIILGEKERVRLPGNAQLDALEWQKQALKMDLDSEVKYIKDQRNPTHAIDVFADFLGSFRSAKAALDISAPMNQGAFAMMTNPRAWIRAWEGTFPALKESSYKEYLAKLHADPRFPKIYATGVDMPGLSSPHGEEMFISKMLENVPIAGHAYKASRLEYDAFLARMRMEAAWDNIQNIEAGGKPLSKEGLKFVGAFTNATSGRGMSKLFQALSAQKGVQPFFAPRYWSSLWETAFPSGLVRDAMTIGKAEGDWRPLKFMAGKYARAYAIVGTVLAAGMKAHNSDLRNWQLVTDPQDIDFGRLRKVVGNETHTLDVLPAQVTQPIRTLAQYLLGRRDYKGLWEDPRSMSAWARTTETLFEGKASPVIKTGLSMFRGTAGVKTFGESYDPRTGVGWWNAAKSLWAPISLAQLPEVWSAQHLTDTEKLWLTALSPFGRGGNVREGENQFSFDPDVWEMFLESGYVPKTQKRERKLVDGTVEKESDADFNARLKETGLAAEEHWRAKLIDPKDTSFRDWLKKASKKEIADYLAKDMRRIIQNQQSGAQIPVPPTKPSIMDLYRLPNVQMSSG